jgi:hypothetical protein
LVHVHRTNTEQLAVESPFRLYRDLNRWAISSAGRRSLGRRALPAREEVATWISTARQRMESVEPSPIAPLIRPLKRLSEA